jgi:glycosyltransferase involved in cell wall biosynthesis
MTPTSDLRVSVVIPTFGRPRQLRHCLDAIARQTIATRHFEVVIVDDGSPERHDDLLLEYASRLRLRLVRQANAGPAVARNRGAMEAVAPLLAFTDDDCRPCPEWLERLLAARANHPGALVGGQVVNGLPDDVFATASQLILDMVYEHFNTVPTDAYFFASNNVLCGRDEMVALGGFDTSFRWAGAEDRDFCDRWRATKQRLVWQPDAVVEHFHAQSLLTFAELHYRYGRGAHLYHAKRQIRGSGTMRADLGFHRSLPRRVLERVGRPLGPWRSVQICGALALWEVVNAVGFFMQACDPPPHLGEER